MSYTKTDTGYEIIYGNITLIKQDDVTHYQEKIGYNMYVVSKLNDKKVVGIVKNNFIKTKFKKKDTIFPNGVKIVTS
jgi:hypothetical protein